MFGFRTKRAPRVPEGERVFAIGDVHGRSDLLAETFRRIDDRMREVPMRRNVEVLLGDYVDRGSDSRGVLDLIVARKATREVVTLGGNHEVMMGDALSGREPAQMWLENGGLQTLLSYGVIPDLGRGGPDALAALVAAMRETMPVAHASLLAGLQWSFALGDYLFVHAGIRPGRPLDRQTVDDLAWIRQPFLGSQASHGAIVVHGHTPVSTPQIRPNRIAIDTGAYATGRLTCLVLEGEQRSFIGT